MAQGRDLLTKLSRYLLCWLSVIFWHGNRGISVLASWVDSSWLETKWALGLDTPCTCTSGRLLSALAAVWWPFMWSFFMWWTTAAALKACYERRRQEILLEGLLAWPFGLFSCYFPPEILLGWQWEQASSTSPLLPFITDKTNHKWIRNPMSVLPGYCSTEVNKHRDGHDCCPCVQYHWTTAFGIKKQVEPFQGDWLSNRDVQHKRN